jgi:hypothetical protein
MRRRSGFIEMITLIKSKVIIVKQKSNTFAAEAPDEMVPDRKMRAELHVSAMTVWRWDRDPALAALGWPPLIRIAGGKVGRKYRSRFQLENFKANLVQRAIAQRSVEA